MTAPTLQFIRSAQRQGFTNVELSRLSSTNSASAIRELVQNSLDAAVERKDVDVAEVYFIVEDTNHDDIPGIKEYKTALDGAVEFLAGHDEQTDSVAKSMQTAVGQSKSSTLFVLDNGIGFDEDRMSAMYDNGISKKEGKRAAGSYGNGHFTTFALSKLRYVFYGGINAGASIFGGHAIIASHPGKKHLLGKDGYYVSALNHESLLNEKPYVFHHGKMPEFINDKIDLIKLWGSGSVIAVPDFNYFESGDDDEKLMDLIINNVAMNFFVAIHNEELRVTVRVHG